MADWKAFVNPVPSESEENKAALVEEVKSICRADTDAKMAWCNWCDQNTGGTKDPNRIEATALRSFITGIRNGYGMLTPGAGAGAGGAGGRGAGKSMPEASGPELAELIKMGQRNSKGVKQAWVMFCEYQGQKTFDPSRHERPFLIMFLDFMGAAAMNAMQSGGGGGGGGQDTGQGKSASNWVLPPAAQAASLLVAALTGKGVAPAASTFAPPAKRPRLDSPMPWAPPQAQQVAILAQKVKEMQKSDPVKKEQWKEFCDAHGKGTYDPTRHAQETLEMFFATYAPEEMAEDVVAAPSAAAWS